jgi:hypothetical protein
MAKRVNDGDELIKTSPDLEPRVKAEAAEGDGAQRQPRGDPLHPRSWKTKRRLTGKTVALGPSLARVTQAMHPDMSIIFVAQSQFRASALDMGEFISAPAEIEDVVAAVARKTSKLAV